jgi:hypothetical protein
VIQGLEEVERVGCRAVEVPSAALIEDALGHRHLVEIAAAVGHLAPVEVAALVVVAVEIDPLIRELPI